MQKDIENGICCALCKRYFADDLNIKLIHRGKGEGKGYAHGYPVACLKCWDEDSIYQKAKVGTV
jgi:hypothetical protein